MIVTERDYMVQKEYYRDQMRAARRYHLARQARAERGAGASLYARALAWLRRYVASWTLPRQERYERVAPPAVPQPR
jgi:hypothetical protein